LGPESDVKQVQQVEYEKLNLGNIIIFYVNFCWDSIAKVAQGKKLIWLVLRKSTLLFL